MPQMHNPSITLGIDTSAFGRNSRFMTVNRFSDHARRRMKVLNDHENQMVKIKIQSLERTALFTERRQRRVNLRVRDTLMRITAYQLVARKNCIKNLEGSSYQRALNRSYSTEALKPQIKDMMKKIEPAYQRSQRAHRKLEQSKLDQRRLIQRNLATITLPSVQKSLIKVHSDDAQEENISEEQTSNSSHSEEPMRANAILRDELPDIRSSFQSITKKYMQEANAVSPSRGYVYKFPSKITATV